MLQTVLDLLSAYAGSGIVENWYIYLLAGFLLVFCEQIIKYIATGGKTVV